MDGLIYAYNGPGSTSQQAYTKKRLAEMAEQRRQRKVSALQDCSPQYIERTPTNMSETTTASSRKSVKEHKHANTIDSVLSRSTLSFATTKSDISTQTSSTEQLESQQAQDEHLPSGPFELRHGRRYLRDAPYPLPCDLAEMQRQNLRTMLGCQVFGRAACAPRVAKDVPRKVLELGCGSGYWSTVCHDYFSQLGYKDVSFTGLDLAPLAPDLAKQGINWTFVQHDMRTLPLPFKDGEFDFVMMKDISLALPTGNATQKLTDEAIRILRVGGTLEMWESDHVLRSLLPHHPAPSSSRTTSRELDLANKTGTFLLTSATPFADAQNRYLQQANRWLQSALERRGMTASPSAKIKQNLQHQRERLTELGMRRVAVPLGKLLWERDCSAAAIDSPLSASKAGTHVSKLKLPDRALSPDQLALRQTALLTVVQMFESLEPLLKDATGKSAEEWNRWWTAVMADVSSDASSRSGPGGLTTGECLEMGAWWATKKA